MFCLIKPTEFVSALSTNATLKFTLAWATFGGVVIPSALLMSLGLPEKYILPGMLAVIPLFQYVLLCIFPALNRIDRIQDNKISVHAFPVLHHNVNDFGVMYPRVEEKPGGYYIVEARTGVGKTSVYADALLQISGTSVPRLSGTYRKPMVILAEGQTDLDIIAFLTSTEAEKKTRDEAIKVQRKPLDTPLDFSAMLLSNLSQHGS